MSARKPLPLDEIRARWDYDPETGAFRWKISIPSKHIVPGTVSRALSGAGYVMLSVAGRTYRAHRVAWALVRGTEPFELDHINGDRKDNRITNLRPCNHSQNQSNIGKKTRKFDLPTGVHMNGRGYRAVIMVDYRYINIGTYVTPEAARKAYVAASRRYFGEFARVE